MKHIQRCIECGKSYAPTEIIYTCRSCGGLLQIEYDLDELQKIISEERWRKRPLSVWKYREFLPISDTSRIISLQEGGTPLYNCKNLATFLGMKELYVKNEGANPTGSFKDRGMTVGLSKALELRMNSVACASTGNTSASLAAYAAKAGLPCFVFIPSGKIAMGKLSQAIIHGAKVLAIKGNFDEALALVRQASEMFKIYLLNSINPFRLEGQKTIGFEIYDQLDSALPDRIILPVGNAGNISAIWKGLTEFKTLGILENESLPKMMGIQAEGAMPIVNAVKRKCRDRIDFVDIPETIATAIRIGHPVSWRKALSAIYESGGTAISVTDLEIIEAQKLLARKEGLFVEPASAASIAGLGKLLTEGIVEPDERIICITTGHGLKDPDAPIKFGEKPIDVEASIDAIQRVIEPEMSRFNEND